MPRKSYTLKIPFFKHREKNWALTAFIHFQPVLHVCASSTFWPACAARTHRSIDVHVQRLDVFLSVLPLQSAVVAAALVYHAKK